MGEKVIDYKIVKAWDEDFFEKLVKDYLASGWSLVGGPFYAENQYCQAMIKREAENES